MEEYDASQSKEWAVKNRYNTTYEPKASESVAATGPNITSKSRY